MSALFSKQTSKIEIIDLYQKPESIPTVAKWIYDEFWSNKAGYSPDFFEKLLRNANDANKIPISFLAIINGVPVGTANLIENDDEARTHLKPWLAALYVLPEYRSFGVGPQLVKAVLRRAKLLNYSKVYLGTDNPGFYERLGAKSIDKARADLYVMEIEC